jgi:hypothetical protein
MSILEELENSLNERNKELDSLLMILLKKIVYDQILLSNNFTINVESELLINITSE